jgi:SNF2 family DNA or RNA helicase
VASPAGVVRRVGGWLEVTFPHDLRVAHTLRGLGARRLGLGVWRVPSERLSDLARRLKPFAFEWEADAGDLYVQEQEREAKLEREDRLALKIKGGESVLGSWSSPVQLLIHQQVAAEFLVVRSGALLCDEQGLGKTLTALIAFWLLRQQGEAERLLVVCPNSLKHSWEKEIHRFFPEWRVSLAEGYKRRRLRAYSAAADIYLVNYEAARSDDAELRFLLRRRPTILVCDESHTAKNAGSRTAWSLAFLRSAAARVWLMSGTPVTNRMEDCYAQVFVADGGRMLGSKDEFWARYIRRSDRDSATKELKHALAPILLRRTKDEVLDLPEKVFESRYVELRGEQREMYEAIRRNLYSELKAMPQEVFDRALPNVLTRLLRLSQVASNPRLVFPDFAGDPAKVKEIDGLLEDLIVANGRKVVLWSHYVRTIEELLTRYRQYNPVAVYGGIETSARAKAVERFQQEPDAMLFIGNPQAAGTGLTLTAAHYAIYETLTWRYDLYAQSIDRTHRIGQTRNVTYFRVLAHDTIDMEIAESLERKRELAAELLGDQDRLPRYTKEDILRMLSSRSRS